MFKSSFIVMVINMLSRILGLVREMIIGSVFGATGMTDAYFSATKIPNCHSVINIDHLESLSDSFSGNMMAKMTRGLKSSVSRKYVKSLMDYLGL